MNFGIIFLIFGLQIVFALLVIVVLKKLLDRELIDSALEQFEVVKYQGDSSLLKMIAVVAHKDLNNDIRSRFKSVAARRFKGIPVEFSTDAGLKGGVKIVVQDAVIDCTLSGRLDKLFGGNK